MSDPKEFFTPVTVNNVRPGHLVMGSQNFIVESKWEDTGRDGETIVGVVGTGKVRILVKANDPRFVQTKMHVWVFLGVSL